VEISGTNFTPRKRRHVKEKEQLDDSSLGSLQDSKMPKVPRKLKLLLNQFHLLSFLLLDPLRHLT
jgi:hypothetical protein